MTCVAYVPDQALNRMSISPVTRFVQGAHHPLIPSIPDSLFLI